MTLLIIVLVVFLIIQANSKTTLTTKSKEYWRRNKSNAKLQYDTACETIKQMGETYREYLSTISINEYLYDGKNEKDNYNYLLENKFDCWCPEYAWLISTIRASHLNADKDCMKIIYGEKIWESLPDTYSKEFLQSWIERFDITDVKKENLKRQLNRIITLKQQILHDKQNGNSYTEYTNSKALDYVAQEFNLPTNEEKCKLDQSHYENLQDLCFMFTCRHSHQEQYKHTHLTMICESPTEEQKKVQYEQLSYEEKLSKEINDQQEVRDKYKL